jgi:hypothetical protein
MSVALTGAGGVYEMRKSSESPPENLQGIVLHIMGEKFRGKGMIFYFE